MKKLLLGEAHDILQYLPLDQLKMFDKIRKDPIIWDGLQAFAKMQKDIKMDQIYRLRRPTNQDDILRNALDHEYYASRISSLVVLLQVAENADAEMERRDRKEK